jgi:hypothetical protein
MPTNIDETIRQRYERELSVELEVCRQMAPEQIFHLRRRLADAEFFNEKMMAALVEITKIAPSAAAPKLRRVIAIAAQAIKEVTQ